MKKKFDYHWKTSKSKKYKNKRKQSLISVYYIFTYRYNKFTVVQQQQQALIILGTKPFEVCGSDEKIRASSDVTLTDCNNHITFTSTAATTKENTSWGFTRQFKANGNNANILKQSGGKILIFYNSELNQLLLLIEKLTAVSAAKSFFFFYIFSSLIQQLCVLGLLFEHV